MKQKKAGAPASGGGFLARGHDRLRFTDLPESFFARVILAKCSDTTSKDVAHVNLSLSDLFRTCQPEELKRRLTGATFTTRDKTEELAADVINAFGGELRDRSTTSDAVDYYNEHIASRLEWLKSGDSITWQPRDGSPNRKFNTPPCIEDFEQRGAGRLAVFEVSVRPAVLVDRLALHIKRDMEFHEELARILLTSQYRPADSGPRMDYRKQLELLTDYLDERQKLTWESEFALLSSQIPFRWLLLHLPIGAGVTIPAAGTTRAVDKILLPFFLEINGLLDIVDLDLESDPLEPNDVVVRYVVRRPATRNIFSAIAQGLDTHTRALLNETQLSLYSRLHASVREGLVFGGRPKLEMSFGTCCSWLVRKAAYCLEEPSFLGNPARQWLQQHKNEQKVAMEDAFFLPAIYERLRNDFGSRVVKKPERYGGEIDVLFDDLIPIELKVRRGRRKPLNAVDVDDSFPPSGQAAAYAAVSRLGFVIVLDLPRRNVPVANLEACAKVIERRFPADSPYPTSIVLIVFRCCQATPSTTR